jgi:hypothetical protein
VVYRTLFSAILGLTCAGEATAAESATTVGGGLVTGLAQARDDTLVPIRWMGPEFGFTGSFRLDTPNYCLDSRLRFALALLFDPHGTLGVAAYPGLWAGFRLPVTTTKWGPLRIGAEAGMHESLMSYQDWDDDHLYWLGVIALGPSAELAIPTSPKRSLDVVLTIPLVALVSRSPEYRLNKADDMVSVGYWLSRAFAAPKPATVNHLQSVSLRVTHRAKARGFHLDPWAELELDSYAEPRRVTSLGLWLGAEARWGL